MPAAVLTNRSQWLRISDDKFSEFYNMLLTDSEDGLILAGMVADPDLVLGGTASFGTLVPASGMEISDSFLLLNVNLSSNSVLLAKYSVWRLSKRWCWRWKQVGMLMLPSFAAKPENVLPCFLLVLDLLQ
jgi:hypothetical protein